MPGNIANLRKASAARTAAATARAENALVAMIKAGEPVTFRGLAARAGVSLDFLYRNEASASASSTTAQPARNERSPPEARPGRTTRQASCAR